eukprot:scaffold1610_cov257-Pinguiococcus_pyrenoidosus.AAC.63
MQDSAEILFAFLSSGAAVLLAAILGASILPAIQTATVMSKVEVVRNEESGTNEIQMKPKFARLSPLSINKKLSQIPVFYVADSSTGEPIIGAGNEGKFYLDPTDAEKVMSSTGKGKLAVATLDEVYYPLITKRCALALAWAADDAVQLPAAALQTAAQFLWWHA